MIKSVTVTNHLGESIKMELGFPEKSGFLIQDITGLGPTKATINLTEMSTSDGGSFNSARVSSRNIVFTLKLLGEPIVETTRQKTYKYFPIKRPIKLTFETDNRTCYIYGNVESNEPIIFSKQETTQISIICPDPYFYSVDINNTVFSGVESLFQFPFSNESLTENLIEFGNLIINQAKSIVYAGDSEIGVAIYIHVLGEATNILITNSLTRETMKIDTTKLTALIGSGLQNGDDLIISTVKGKKTITLIRDGVSTNILNCLDKNPDWFVLAKGDNIFSFAADTGTSNLQFRIENQIIYEGV